MDTRNFIRMMEQTDHVDCQETYGPNFTICQTESGLECCFVGEPADPIEINKDPLDCTQKYGSKFEDCERDWGWDCCMVDEFPLENGETEARTENLEPIDCYKTLGEQFADCQTELGWDCCFVGEEMDGTEESKPVGPSTCSVALGPEFTDCGMGYGLDCCYVDDGKVKHTHEETNDKENDVLKHFTPIYESHEALSCAEQLGTNFTDCGRGFGLDCCYIDDGHFLHSHHMAGDLPQNGPGGAGVLRWLVLVAVVAFMGISKAQRNAKSRSSVRPKIPQDDDEFDESNDDEIELKPLI